MTKARSIWSTFLVINAMLFFWLGYYGVYEYILNTDITYISFGVMGIYLLTLASIGFELSGEKSADDKFEHQWFISNYFPALGLLGTVIGLNVGLEAIGNIEVDVKDQVAIMGIMVILIKSLGTALVTTIVGLIAMLLMKLQLKIIDEVHKNEIF